MSGLLASSSPLIDGTERDLVPSAASKRHAKRNRAAILLPLSLSLMATGPTACAPPLAAPPQAPQASGRVRSPEVHADGGVTFRLRAPKAQAVTLTLEGAEPLVMQKEEPEIFSV